MHLLEQGGVALLVALFGGSLGFAVISSLWARFRRGSKLATAAAQAAYEDMVVSTQLKVIESFASREQTYINRINELERKVEALEQAIERITLGGIDHLA